MKWEIGLHELEPFAQDFWQQVGDTKIFLFYGQMGAGKTTIITALCHALGVRDAVSSPTFAIINEYATGNGQPVFHMDLYRLKDEAEAQAAGVEDCIASGAICLIEWPERAPQLFDKQVAEVHIEALENGKRKLLLTLPQSPGA